ncbi:lysophospholipid acyltransferase family protein [Microbulbifer thermotolerans]|uniref:Lipid A biosynthesis lauroyl acyltransferase n=1 Tax=Microbulbifer thermotolerans TaxID=252514 RepID=A0A143HI53_MICTH|nr:lysophospholipid acyltransferase family protein [Microbulbifer thermotolerans]AMX01186.1 lipid A biosynthesis lauroyl acyltransferase [Microbulbifer thermotolerans]MCX2778499.1 lysophospholipid acyltransferase family protein [Microbulbifer thermotolerans]MCX2793983.1 lysophospholipid acyltransferase family protein [Microbulbifer thermotolerans]MCX2801687.1 lysophospholipid acyltransferase family protein [Microbulbifer thermotolerans]MCX2803992.1 lysophospholipid acyltransferase family prote
MDIKSRLAVAALKLVGRLPLRWSRRLGRLFGRLAILSRSDSLRVSRINLQLCYPAMDPDQREQLARNSVLHTAMTGFEVATIWRQPWSRSEDHIVRVRNQQLLCDGVEEGRGVLVLMPHTGNWEIFGMYLATLGPSTALYAPPKIAALDPIIRSGREATGTNMVPTNVHGVRALLKALKAGNIVMVLPDQEPDMGGDFAPFFGRPALTMTLAYNLLQRTGCRCVFGFGKRVEGGFELVFLPAEQAIYSDEQKVSLAAMNRGVEACIAEAPEQYQWEYKRFRKQPEGKSRIYQKNRR